MADRAQVRQLTVDLLLNVALALVSELAVHLTGWSRLPVLFVVFAAGHLANALLRHRADDRASPSRGEAADHR